ncbi:MAG: DUF2630 family protein, partial [Actinomycetota bacterium]|nr:DUF2630 family protein [Actinomycetota bacterium]
LLPSAQGILILKAVRNPRPIQSTSSNDRRHETVTKSVMQTIQNLSREREKLISQESGHHAGDGTRKRLQELDHDLQVLWDLRRRQMAGENVDFDETYFDRYTVDPGDDAPGGGRPV